MFLHLLRSWTWLAGAFLTVGLAPHCMASEQATPQVAHCTASLKVMLFSYIPACGATDDLSAMKIRTEAEFRKQSGYCAEITIADKDYLQYDSEGMAKAFLSSPAKYDLIESDMVILQELVGAGAIKPWTQVDPKDWWPSAIKAVTTGGKIYGVPHLMCGEFVIARDKSVLAAKTSTDLKAALDGLATPQANIGGDAAGGYTLTGLYLDAWMDTNPGKDATTALTAPVDASVVGHLKEVLGECMTTGSKPCLTDYDDSAKEATDFAENKLDAMFGYSERLHYVLRDSPKHTPGENPNLDLIPAPLGSGTGLATYTDALLMRAGCNGMCEKAGQAFAKYLNSKSTMKWYLSGEDCPAPHIARYLIPATRSAFKIPNIKSDRFYQSIQRSLADATTLPNGGIEGNRKRIQKEVLEAIE